ncbi:hypothetical protein I551_8849 [Mycobacterium ulcerans str. Harvey]|uniref:Uncharacterized protein n=1 Tax=Mycobacterium ulcerans str. Harvey TaxID=1299332 RepID=A0ABP3ATY8_MYCUL|nr:hypothetical protein I551_8849 [Mycobacterium ulcerans str. Harvey]
MIISGGENIYPAEIETSSTGIPASSKWRPSPRHRAPPAPPLPA